MKSVSAFSILSREITMQIPKMTDDELLDRYLRALKPAFAIKVRLRPPTTFEEAMLFAERCEESLFSYKAGRSAPGPVSQTPHVDGVMDVDAARIIRGKPVHAPPTSC